MSGHHIASNIYLIIHVHQATFYFSKERLIDYIYIRQITLTISIAHLNAPVCILLYHVLPVCILLYHVLPVCIKAAPCVTSLYKGCTMCYQLVHGCTMCYQLGHGCTMHYQFCIMSSAVLRSLLKQCSSSCAIVVVFPPSLVSRYIDTRDDDDKTSMCVVIS